MIDEVMVVLLIIYFLILFMCVFILDGVVVVVVCNEEGLKKLNVEKCVVWVFVVVICSVISWLVD